MSKENPGYLGRYRLLNVVNTGQTSQMWQAYHDGTHQFFAVKTLLDKFRRAREQVWYLKWEYAVGAKLEHDRVIRVHEYNVDRGTPYLAMEWFAAPNMKKRIQAGLESYGYLVPKMALQATEALAYFSSQGWVHRDVKPDNFLVSDDGDVKLIDFALAKPIKRGLAKLFTVRSKVQGTRSYMSPEQIRGLALDDRADLYSLACTLFELVSGKPPYTGTSQTDLLMKHLKAAPPSLEAANRNVTPEFAQLIRKAMSKKLSARHKSVTEFFEELQGVRILKRTPDPPQQVKKGD